MEMNYMDLITSLGQVGLHYGGRQAIDTMEMGYMSFITALKQTANYDTYVTHFFGNTHMTNEQRILVMKHLFISRNIRLALCGDVKCAKKSEEIREVGNKVFTTGTLSSPKCLEAFKAYSKSLAYAPMGSKQLAMSYANRSAVLFRMKKYAECLKNIEGALECDYPDTLRSKLYLRKIECLAKLKNCALDDGIEEAKSWLSRISINDRNRNKFMDKINQILEENSSKEVVQDDNQLYKIKKTIPIIENPNPEVPCISDALAIRYSEKYGRHVVATRNIRPGEVLVIEKPYCTMLESSNIETHCYNCMEVCWSTIPCDNCVVAMYCSKECKADDWNACHDVECPVLSTLLHAKCTNQQIMSLRLSIVAIRKSGGIENIQRIIKEVDEQEDLRTKGFTENGIYDIAQYRTVCSLSTNLEKRSGQDLLKRAFEATFILTLVSQCPKQTFITDRVSDNFGFIGGLILKHQLIIQTNAHVVHEECVSFNGDRSVAVQPFLSLLNHSCNNNAFRHAALGHQIVYSMYPIEEGEQITDNYGHHYALEAVGERQWCLLEQYYFFCDCIPCREEWPLYTDIKSYKVLLANAKTRRKLATVLAKYDEYYDYGLQFPQDSDFSHIIDDLLRMIEVLYNNAPRPCRELCNVVETLKRFYAIQGNRFDIPEI